MKGYKHWNNEETTQLIAMAKEGVRLHDMAIFFGVEQGRIATKLYNIGIKTKYGNSGHINGMWKGDNVTYESLHEWIRANIKIPKTCGNCNTNNKRLDLHNISGNYTKELSDWIYLCRRCHMEFDGRLKNKRLDGKFDKKKGSLVNPRSGRMGALYGHG